MKKEKPTERKNYLEAREDDVRECYLPSGRSFMLAHHLLLWKWGWWHTHSHGCCCCCCCCNHGGKAGGGPSTLTIDARLAVGRIAPGAALHVICVPAVGSVWARQYLAEFYIEWNASGGSGQITVKVDLISGPGSPAQVASGRGPNDALLYAAQDPGTYLFRITATDSAGNTVFDTVQVDCPRIAGC